MMSGRWRRRWEKGSRPWRCGCQVRCSKGRATGHPWRQGPRPAHRARALAGGEDTSSALAGSTGSPQHLADERHGQPPLRGEGRLIEGIEQIVESAHVARETALQPARSLLRKLEAAQPGAQLQRLLLLRLIERAQLQNGPRGAARAEIGQRPGEQRRGRPRRHDQRPAALLDFAQQTEDRLFPLETTGDGLEIIEADTLQLRQALQYADTEGRELSEREVPRATRFGRLRARCLQQMRLARARRATNPSGASDFAGGHPPGMRDRLTVAGGQETREYRPIR